MMDRVRVGEVFHYFGKAGVAAIRVTEGEIKVGDRLQFQGPTTNFEQVIESMQIDKETVQSVSAGREVGIKVSEKCREGDFVYKL